MVGSPALLRLVRRIAESSGLAAASSTGASGASTGASGASTGAGSTRSLGGLWSVGLLALACSGSQSSEPEWPPRVPASFRSGDALPAGSSPGSALGPSGGRSSPAPTASAEPGESESKPTGLAEQYAASPSLEAFAGKATYYADSLAGNSTASGEPYDPRKHSAAHRKLPFGTVVRVIRQDTGAVTYARVNDRGPFGSRDRIIDLSRAAAEDLEMLRAGVVRVRVEVVARPE